MANILVLSYDFSGRTLTDRDFVEQKIKRDGYGPDDRMLTICWSRTRASVDVSNHVRIEALRARTPGFRPLYDLLFIWSAPRIARTNGLRPDSIVISDFSLVWAARAVQRSCGGLIELHLNNLPGDLAKTRGVLQRIYAAFAEKFGRRIPDRFIVINETTRRYLLERGIASDRITLRAPDTILRDLPLINAAKRGVVRAHFGIPAATPILLSVGRLEKEKGFPELLDVFAKTDIDATLIIVGDGILRASLEEKVRSLGIEQKVIFAGMQERTDIWNYFADADAFVLLSQSEALGLVFWEAMYMRVPVIGRPIGGIKETIGNDGERGFLWNSADGTEGFKRKIEQALSRSNDVQTMIERARVYVLERVKHQG